MNSGQTLDLNKMRQEIADALAHEQRHGTLARMAMTAIKKAQPAIEQPALTAKADKLVAEVRRFVEAMIEVIEQTVAAAERENLGPRMAPIFETALAYLDERVDFIPDELGLAGLLDDAYLVHGLMQEISNRHRSLTGQPLLPDQYFNQSQRMRRLIGEPTATRLDVAIVAFARRQNVRETVDQIVERIGDRGLCMALPTDTAFFIANEFDDDLPSLELGSLGGR